MRLTDKVAIVTGAARGIGRASAERLLAEGAKVVISDIDEEQLNRTAVELGAAGRVLVQRADVAKKSDVLQLIEATANLGNDEHVRLRHGRNVAKCEYELVLVYARRRDLFTHDFVKERRRRRRRHPRSEERAEHGARDAKRQGVWRGEPDKVACAFATYSLNQLPT